MKKALVMILAFTLVLTLLAGCGGKKNVESSGTTAPTTAQQAGSETSGSGKETEMPKDPITFTMYIAEQNPDGANPNSPVAQKIKELTGVSLDIQYAVGDAKQEMSLMAASGELPDLLFAKTELKLFLDVDGIEKLDDLLKDYGPNIIKLYGEENLKRLRWSKEEPYIYCLGDQPVMNNAGDPTNGFCLQHAVVKELGFPKLRTLADFENAIKTYYAKHPTFTAPDGKVMPTVPLLLHGYDWGYYISIGNPANFATGSSDDGEWVIDPNTLEAKRHVITPSNKEYFQWLNKLWNENLIDKESFTMQHDAYKAKLSTGSVLAIIDAYWNYGGDVHKALRGANMADRTYGRYPLTMNENILYAELQDSGYMGGGSGIAITKACKDKVRAMQFLDWMATEEAQILTNWGIEGVHFRYTAEGKREFLPEVLKQKNEDRQFVYKTGIGQYLYPFPRYGNEYIDSTGNRLVTENPEQIMLEYSEPEKEVLAAYGAKMWRDLYPSKENFVVKPYGAAWKHEGAMDEEWKAINTKVTDLSMKYCAQAITAKPGEFETIWEEFVREMEKAGVRKLEEEFSKALKDRVELWK